ncbi:unnamed protein product [Chrysoparadoxa australica]
MWGLLRLAVLAGVARSVLLSLLGSSRSVSPAEQLGGSMMTPDASNPHWVALQAMILGMQRGKGCLSGGVGEETSEEGYTTLEMNDVAFGDGSPGTVTFTEFAGPVLKRLRERSGISSEEYLSSFVQALNSTDEASQLIEFEANSKSPQRFFFSPDGRFMVKTQKESELSSLLRLLPAYASHMEKHEESLISRFVGIYRVTYPNPSKWSVSRPSSQVLVVTSNVFCTSSPIERKYDLKGSTVGRKAKLKSTVGEESGEVATKTVLKDLDLHEAPGKINLGRREKTRLLRALEEDARLLSGLGLMDYSLLAGLQQPQRGGFSRFIRSALRAKDRDKGRNGWRWGYYRGKRQGEVWHMGVIDVLQAYNLKKELETLAKGVIHDKHSISAVPPPEYADRFLGFIDAHTE